MVDSSVITKISLFCISVYGVLSDHPILFTTGIALGIFIHMSIQYCVNRYKRRR